MRERLILILKWLLTKRYNAEAFDFWIWENTPWPVGSPNAYQIWWGYKWALLPRGWAGEAPTDRYDREYMESRKDYDPSDTY